MKKLTISAYEKAVAFLNEQARPLEKALYAYHFAHAPADSVFEALANFQNPDGGFGHGLECDIRLGDSSVIATTVALQHLREVHAPADQPTVQRACRYLLDQYDEQRVNWPIIPPNIDDALHAPWWVHGGSLENSLSNPRAEIAGYVNEFAAYFPQAMCEQVTKAVVDHLVSHPDHMEMHDLLCYLRFAETPNLPADIKTTVWKHLQRIAEKNVERRAEAWMGYSLPPLSVIASPESPLAPLFRSEIEQNLDFMIEAQGGNGTWSPAWDWGDPNDETWLQAKQEWTGVLTLKNLCVLKAFGRIE